MAFSSFLRIEKPQINAASTANNKAADAAKS
jgi:hypothetical protein